LEGFDYDSDPSCKQDTNGNWYREILFKWKKILTLELFFVLM
jgi:hypothetical protein